MPATIATCQKCGRKLQFETRAAVVKAKCPSCGTLNTIKLSSPKTGPVTVVKGVLATPNTSAAASPHSRPPPSSARSSSPSNEHGNHDAGSGGSSWYVRVGEQSHGPYTSLQLEQYIGEGRVVRSSLVKHKEHTADRWEQAGAIAVLTNHFVGSHVHSAPPVAPGESASIHSQIASNLQQRIRPAESRTFWNIVFDIIDPRFRYYVTPWIVRATWCIILFVSMVFLVLFVVAMASVLLELAWPASPTPPRPSPDQVGVSFPEQIPQTGAESELLDFVLNVHFILFAEAVLVLIFVLWIRVLLEAVIVLFDISNTLKRIESK